MFIRAARLLICPQCIQYTVSGVLQELCCSYTRGGYYLKWCTLYTSSWRRGRHFHESATLIEVTAKLFNKLIETLQTVSL